MLYLFKITGGFRYVWEKKDDGKIDFDSLPKEEQDRIIARMKEIGDHIAQHYEELMQARLERARAAVDQNIGNSDKPDEK